MKKQDKWLDAANDGDDKLVCEINPVREIHVGEDVKIKGIICEADHWIIQDEGGALWNAKLPNYEMEKILDFHAGPITCVASSPVNYDLASGGSDGTSDVTALTFSNDGELLTTGSKDNTIFFFHCTNNYKALGFCKVPGAVTSMDWAPNGKHLLVGCHNGDIVEVTRPGTDGDTTRSFELILTMKAYTFRRPKIKKSKPPPKVMPSIKTEEPPKEEAQPSPTSEEPKLGDVTLGQEQAEAITIDQNLEGGTTNEGSKEEQVPAMEPQDGTKGKSEEAPPEFHSDGKPSQVEAKPAEVLPLIAPIQEEEPDDPPGNTFPVRALMYTHGSLGTFYLALEGRASGYIYECHIDSEEVLGYTPWLASVKFMHFTHSSEFLISGSDDGMLRVQKVPPPGQLKLAETNNYWEAGVHDGFYGVVGGAVLSYDEKYLASVSYDGSFFVQSIDLGKAVEVLHHKPPDAAKLEQKLAAEIEDVTGVALSIEEQRAKTEQDERLRLAMEKKNVVLAKVDTLRNSLAVLMKEMNERERNEKLPMEHFEIDPHVRIMLAEEEKREVDQAQKELQWDSEKRNVALQKLKAWYLDPLEVERIVLYAFMSGQVVSSFRTAKLSSEMQEAIAEAKKQKGIRRWTKLQRGRETSFNLKDKEENDIIIEQKTMDSEEDDIEAEMKKLEGVSKSEQRRLMLKIRDKEMTKYISTKSDETWVSEEDAKAIEDAESNKGDFKLKSDPAYIVPEELQVNARIKRNEMLLFTEEIYLQKMAFNQEFLALRVQKKEMREEIAKNNQRISQINSILKCVPVLERRLSFQYLVFVSFVLAFAIYKDLKAEVREYEEKKKAAQEAALKQVEQESQHTKLKYEKNVLLEQNSAIISSFDNALEDLRTNRFNLEVNIKAAALKMMALYQELHFLQKSQPTEESLDKKIHEKMKSVHDMRVKLEEQEKLMEAKKEEITLLTNRREEIMNEFDRIFPEPDDPQKPILHKLFIKIIRRVKRNPDGTLADSDEDSDLEETVADADDEDYEDDDVIEVCPPNVTQYFYDQMFKLRERRVEEDWLIKEANKALDVLTRERDNIVKKKKLTDASLESVEKEIAIFQKEKQYSLNEIDIVLSLKMHQIEFLEGGELPEDLSRGLVFDNAVFQNLKDIIADHMKAKQSLKKLHKELRKEHQTLNREKKIEDERTANIEARCVEVQMLKFGQVIDMEVLDVISKDMKKDTKELKEQLRTQETQHGLEIHEWNKKIEDATDDFAEYEGKSYCNLERSFSREKEACIRTLTAV
ncbi:hypothetical protein R1flu_000376 [Riccia fluitans]|uniref:Cilia- and flagella-associated protein 43 n=1 Tax=Riccia fluitans TaxID=41844 RepID=A0ABD1Y097_9MARC